LRIFHEAITRAITGGQPQWQQNKQQNHGQTAGHGALQKAKNGGQLNRPASLRKR
jgi:hypothetical protein